MKRIIYLIVMITSLAVSVLAQPGKPKARLRLDAAKIAFFTQRLDLSPEEAQQFWPVYNSYQKEFEELIRQRALSRRKATASAETTDPELESKSQLLELQKRYSQQFIKILPKQKAVAIFRAERDFRQSLIKELGERRNKAAIKN